MKNENFAERLFVDLRNGEIELAPAEYVVDGAKIGQFPNIKQFTIFGVKAGKEIKYKFGSGVIFQNIDEPILTFTEAYEEFLNAVKSMGPKLKFYSLIIPNRGVVEVRLEEFAKVVSRYIQDYLPMTDEISERWDVMVGPK